MRRIFIILNIIIFVTAIAVHIDTYANSLLAEDNPSSISPPPGMIGWWPAEGNANDIANNNCGHCWK